MQECNCAICGGNKTDFLYKANDNGYFIQSDKWFDVVRCKNCGLVYVNPRPDPDEIGVFYPSETYWPGLYDDLTSHSDLEYLRRKVDPFLRFADRLFTKPGRLLDIGCGDGLLLKMFRDRGWNVSGIDQSESVAAALRKDFGLDVSSARAEDMVIEEKFDIVVLNHVLEHVHDPNQVICNVGRLLNNTGILMISVPDFGSLQARLCKAAWVNLDVPRHLYQFSLNTLDKLLSKHGFGIASVTHRFYSDSVDYRFSARLYFYGKRNFSKEDFETKSRLKKLKNRLLLTAGKFGALLLEKTLPAFGSGSCITVAVRKVNVGK